MYLKSFQMTNFRKYREKDNTVMFVNSDGVRGRASSESVQSETMLSETKENRDDSQINVASATTLIVGKNNAGKTSIIHALLKIIKNNELWKLQVSDFNFHYLRECFNTYLAVYDESKATEKEMVFEAPFIEFVVTVAFEENSDDLLTNLIPFMLLEDIDQDELKIILRYEVSEQKEFYDAMKNALDRLKEKEDAAKQQVKKHGMEFDREKESFQIMLRELEKVHFQIGYYRLCKEEETGKQQVEEATDKFKISDLMDIKFIQANNVKKEEELSEAFNKIITYRYEKIISDKKKELDKRIDEINDNLTESIKEHHSDGINTAIGKIVASDIMEVDLSSNITEEKLVKSLLRYAYVEKGVNIPEGQFGLGYTHLVKIVAELIDYMERYPDDEHNGKINLIAIEEPESFMHPQMQELFIKNINEALSTLIEEKQKKLNSQLFITTHSSHVLNSKIHMGDSLDDICYVYEENGCGCILNLDNNSVISDKAEECKEVETEKDIEKDRAKEKHKDFEFLKKHIKYKVSELFFADAVILVEGFAEETILPFYLEQKPELSKRYISIFGISGAHAFLYKTLLKKLRIPAIIVTDLDVKRDKNSDDEKQKDLSQITDLTGRTTTNRTIKHFNKGLDDLSKLKPFIEEDNIYITYQWKIGKYYATSFEEAFILTNADNAILNDILKNIKPRAYHKIVEKNGEPDYNQNIERSYEWQVKLAEAKGEFASRLLYALVTETEKELPQLPEYIAQGLEWLNQKLG